MVPNKEEQEILSKYGYYSAISILKLILGGDCDTDFDEQVYEFLKERGEVPENFIPYWNNPDTQYFGEIEDRLN